MVKVIHLIPFLILSIQSIGQTHQNNAISEASKLIHSAFYSEADSINKYLLHDSIVVTIAHSISDEENEKIVLKKDQKLKYFTHPKDFDKYNFRGKSRDFEVIDSTSVFQLSLSHNHYFIKSLTFTNFKNPQLIKIDLIDGE